MKLLVSPSSPFSAKCRMAARHLGLEIEAINVNTAEDPAELIEHNPLGKIPVLVRKDEQPIYDSVAIMHFFDRLSDSGLYPKDGEERTKADVLEALADGITDCLVAIAYERRFRSEEKVEQAWIDRQWSKVLRGLDYLENNMPKTEDKLNGGHFALAALLTYLDLRFAGQWADGRPNLAAWPEKFTKLYPDYRK